MNLVLIIISAVLVNNFVMSRFLGICPFLGVSKRLDTALGMSAAVTFVMALASLFTYFVNLLLVRLEIEYLRTIAFILVIASLVQLVEIVLQKVSPTLHQSMGVYLPLITTNCAVLGVANINVNEGYGLLESVVNGTAAAIGFALALILFAGVRERLENSAVPKALRGTPIALIEAGLMAIAFMGFAGLG